MHINLADERDDEIIWTLEESGQYSGSSAYNIQFAGLIPSNFPKSIWQAWAPQSCKVFLWLLLQDRLWTAARLQLRGWKNNYFRVLCERNLETVTHLFIECPFSQRIWMLTAVWSGCQNLHPSSWAVQNDTEDWFYHMTNQGSKMAHTLAILTLWCLWKQRNAVIFRDSRRTEQTLFSEIKDTCATWSLCRGENP